MAEFVAYPTANGSPMPSTSRFNLRKLNFQVSPPGPFAGLKRAASDDTPDDSTRSEDSMGSVIRQRKHDEDEYTANVVSAIRDFYVVESSAWLKRYYHSAVARLQEIKDPQNKDAICKELETSLVNWAKWHSNHLKEIANLSSAAGCAQFLDDFTLALANWSARAGKLRMYFAWVELEYQQPGRRNKRGIVDMAKQAIDAHVVRDSGIWDAVHTAIDTVTPWARPLIPEMLDKIVLLELVYSREVRGSPVDASVADMYFQENDKLSRELDLATAPFSPVLRTLRTGSKYAARQVLVRPAHNLLEDWAARASFWSALISETFHTLMNRAEMVHPSLNTESRFRPEWHTSHRYIEEALPLVASHIVAYALDLSEAPLFAKFLQSACSFAPTQELIFEHLTRMTRHLTEQLTAVPRSAPITERISMLGAARARLQMLCAEQCQESAERRFTIAMQEAIKVNAGPLLVQLRHAVQHGWKKAALAELRSLNLNLTSEDGDDDEMHSRILAEDVAVDLLPTSLGGSAVDANAELEVLATVTGDFNNRGIALSWMPTVMATEASRLKTSNPIYLHYIAWLAVRDPLLTTTIPKVLTPYTPTETPLCVKWHPAWSVVSLNVGGSLFDCSAVQFELIEKLLNSAVPLLESQLMERRLDEPEEAPLARKAALLDLVANSRGFIRYSDDPRVYAVDANTLPSGSFAVARFADPEDT